RSMTPEQRERTYRDEVQAAANKHGVPYAVLHGLIKQESNYDPEAVNARTGATGIAQFMPDTAKEWGFTAGVNPKTDIDKAGEYLAWLHSRAQRQGFTGDDAWAEALRYYNGGIGNWQKQRRGLNVPAIGPEAMAYPGK